MESKDDHRPLTAKIVESYLRHHRVEASQLPDLIAIVHRSLGGLGQQRPAEEVLTPAVSVRQSVRPNYVVCLDCGYRGENPSPPYQQPTRPEPGGISEALGFAARSSPYGPGLFRASIDLGKATWSGSQTEGGRGCGIDASGNQRGKCRPGSWGESETESDHSLRIELRCRE